MVKFLLNVLVWRSPAAGEPCNYIEETRLVFSSVDERGLFVAALSAFDGEAYGTHVTYNFNTVSLPNESKYAVNVGDRNRLLRSLLRPRTQTAQ